ncbi:CRISPR-associated helicase Cas3' [Parapedobacter composti]|nr:CRISPR-associated helicase Cas3' [Parapedobacter composti]
MYNSYSKIEELVSELPPLPSYLKGAEEYYAHIPKHHSDYTNPETLPEHIALVNHYFKTLVATHQLDKVIDQLISGYLQENNIENSKIGEFIKQLFANTIVFHDFGKINENFQANQLKMNNPVFLGREITDSPISTRHSSLGAFIYLSKHLNDIYTQFKLQETPELIVSCFLLSYTIFKHHGRRFDDDYAHTICFSEDLAGREAQELRDFLKRYVDSYQFSVNPKLYQMIANPVIFETPAYKQRINSFSLYALCKLNFSLLTASDYLATNEYMNRLQVKDFGVLDSQRINEIYDYVTQNEWLNEHEGKKNYNLGTFQNIDDYIFLNPKAESSANLNILRKEMAIEVVRNIRKNSHQNLFYIEAPTGGGKTNLSMLAAVELLKSHSGSINKVFYVFPFTTLVTQTYKSIQETLGIKDDEIIELHSKAGFKVNEDDLYGGKKLNYINNLFVNYPFCLLTHIRFFDLLKTNEKGTNYLLHRLANSIVVIDELQSYNPQHWDKVVYFIKQYADKFNIKFILMSATLPKLDKLDILKEQAKGFEYLIPKAKENYFQNPNFCNRVTFNFDLFERKDLTLDELANTIIQESKMYALKDFGAAKPINSVYAIVEFIFKKSASEFYQIIQHTDFFDEIFVLSGTILEHRRKYIINFLKNKANRQKKVLLITTQVVEAGVDIDMDLGFKDRSLIDSDEQLAGRINRNVNKKGCKLFLFNYNKEAIIYGKDKRLEITRNKIGKGQYQEILQTKDFDLLYDLVINDRNEWNTKKMAVGFSEYENKIKALKFQSVHDDFKLIEQNNISSFVPVNIPVEVDGVVDGQKEKIFSKMELDFLSQNHVFPNKYNEISGEKVFDIYLDLIHNRREFIQQKTYEKILQGIMSKYIFSLFASNKIEDQIVHFSDEEKSQFGYKYVQLWDKFYDIETGMKDTDFNSNETQFL